MASTFTTNKTIEKLGSGDAPGTWDAPTNANWGVVDTALGSLASVGLGAGSVVLSAAQAKNAFLVFTGALPGNVTVTIPGLSTSPGTIISGGFYAVQNLCTNSSVCTVTLTTTVAGQQVIGCPPSEVFDIMVEGQTGANPGSVKYRNFGRVGTYWDYAGSSVPNWVSACTIPPYLNCDGTTFSSAVHPGLTLVLGSTTLPDARGKYRAVLNQGTGLITSGSSTGGVDGNTAYATGGAQVNTLSSVHVPQIPIIDPGHLHGIHVVANISAVPGAGSGSGLSGATPASSAGATSLGNTDTVTTGITAGSATPNNFSILPPTYIGGLTLIRTG